MSMKIGIRIYVPNFLLSPQKQMTSQKLICMIQINIKDPIKKRKEKLQIQGGLVSKILGSFVRYASSAHHLPAMTVLSFSSNRVYRLLSHALKLQLTYIGLRCWIHISIYCKSPTKNNNLPNVSRKSRI